jgi:hypothetical protein
MVSLAHPSNTASKLDIQTVSLAYRNSTAS